MTDDTKPVQKRSMFADGTFVTLMFTLLMIFGVWSYINELTTINNKLNMENDMLLKKVIEQNQLISNMNMYLEMQPYLRDGLIVPKNNKYL
jgi:hypothetical protein